MHSISERDHLATTNNVTRTRSYGDYFVSALEIAGVRSAFGITGGAFVEVFNHLTKSKLISVYHCQHEGGAAFLAMGRSTLIPEGEIPVCFSTAGPGVTNLITGVAAAYEERVPILVITGNSSTGSINKGALQDTYWSGINATEMLKSVTAQSVSIRNPRNLIPTLFDLLSIAKKKKRPVHLNIPLDIALESPSDPIGLAHEIKYLHSQMTISKKAIPNETFNHAIKQFLSSKKPLVFAGNGIKMSGLKEKFNLCMQKLNLPVIVSCHGKGAIDEESELFKGTFGFASNNDATQFLEEYQPDAILFIGTRLGEFSSGGWNPLLSHPPLKLHVDIDPNELGKVYSVDFPIHAEIGEFLDQMITFETQYTHKFENKNIRKIRDVHPESKINPLWMLEILDFELPDDAIIFADNGNSMAWTINHLHVKNKRDYYVPLGLASMGAGICNSIGASTIQQDRTIVSIVGDCAMMMNGNELFTAREYNLPTKVFVLNDGGHGMVDHGCRIMGLKNINVRFKKPIDFQALAKAFNVKSFEARSHKEFLALPFEKIWKLNEPVLIEVHVDSTITPPITGRTRILGQS
tara:strand:+ start:354 stop:2087 length:1734 start_codon:yes stop_codon:yes gene_type:complete